MFILTSEERLRWVSCAMVSYSAACIRTRNACPSVQRPSGILYMVWICLVVRYDLSLSTPSSPENDEIATYLFYLHWASPTARSQNNLVNLFIWRKVTLWLPLRQSIIPLNLRCHFQCLLFLYLFRLPRCWTLFLLNLSHIGNLYKTRCTRCGAVRENHESPICPALAGRGYVFPDILNLFRINVCDGLKLVYPKLIHLSALGLAKDYLSYNERDGYSIRHY